jgi:hypothetical protein
MNLRLLYTLLIVLFLGEASSASTFQPKGTYPDEILSEIREVDGSAVRSISLRNKPLAFANNSINEICDPAKVDEFVAVVLARFPVLEALDLSFNRLPKEALIYFVRLLLEKSHLFLEVTTNSGADSLEALAELNVDLDTRGVVLGARPDIFERVIWVPYEHIDGASYLPHRYKAAHKCYYETYKFKGFSLPV